MPRTLDSHQSFIKTKRSTQRSLANDVSGPLPLGVATATMLDPCSSRECDSRISSDHVFGAPSLGVMIWRDGLGIVPAQSEVCAVRLLWRTVLLILACFAAAIAPAAESLPRSVLILDQSATSSVWYAAFSPVFRSTLNAGSAKRISIYEEHLDLSRFGGPQYDELLRNYLREKFRGRPIGLLVAQGLSSLDFVLRSRDELWPGVPVVFAGIDEKASARLSLPADVTGALYQQQFRNAVTTARVLVPNLKRIAVVGDAWERQAVRRHYREEIPSFADEFEFIDLIGLPMTEIRKRVAALPDDTAIIYTSVTLDGAGTTYIPHEGLAAFADVANRPIVVDAETNIGHGGAGGFVTTPGPLARRRRGSCGVSSTAKMPRRFRLPPAISPDRCSTGGSCNASGSARAGCRREAKSGFASRASGINTAGRR